MSKLVIVFLQVHVPNEWCSLQSFTLAVSNICKPCYQDVDLIIHLPYVCFSLGLLNVKIVDGRCTRSVSCTMRLFGHLGENSNLSKIDIILNVSSSSSMHVYCISPSRLTDSSVTTAWRRVEKHGKTTSSQQKVGTILSQSPVMMHCLLLRHDVNHFHQYHIFVCVSELCA